MPFGSTSLDHLSTPNYSLGPSAGFGEVFAASLKRQLYVDSAYGMQVNLRNKYFEQMEKAQGLIGSKITPDWPFALDAITAGIKRSAKASTGPVDLTGYGPNYLADIDRIDLAITQAKTLNPQLKTFEELYQDELVFRQKIMYDAASAIARSNGNPVEVGLENLLGTAISTLSLQGFERDPLFFGSLFAGPGGAGRSVLTKVLGEAAVGGAAMGAQDIMFTAPRAAMLGEEGPDIFNDILFGAVVAGGLRGIFEAASPTYRAAERRLAPQRADARLISDMLSGEPNFGGLRGNRLSDTELLAAAQLLRNTPEKVAAEAQVINDSTTADLAPSGETREGANAANDSVLAALDVLDQARPMNPPSVLFPEGPTTEAVIQDALSASPELKARIDTIDARITQAETVLNNALEQQRAFNNGERIKPGERTFDEQILQVKKTFEEDLATLEEVRKSSRASPDNEKIVLERARIEKKAKDEIVKIGSARFYSDRMLKDEIAKTRRVIRDSKRLREQTLKNAGVDTAPKPKQAQVRATDTEALDKMAKEAEQPKDAVVEPIVAKAEESLKTPPEAKRPPILSEADIEALPPTKQTIELQWGAMNKLDLIREVEAAAALKQTPRMTSTRSSKIGRIPEKDVIGSREGMVKAVYNKLKIPDFERDPVAFDKWRGDYILRTATGKQHVTPKVEKLVESAGLADQFKLSLKGTADKPTLEMRGRDIPVDLEVPGPEGSRTAIEVMDEINDETSMLEAARKCGLDISFGEKK